MSFLTKIFGDPNARVIRAMQPIVDAINKLESEVQALSDQELKERMQGFRSREPHPSMGLRQLGPPGAPLLEGEGGQADLDELLPDVFACVREASRRVLGQRHFDVQLMGGIVLHRGGIAEMRTGEGKTLTATLPVALNALAGRGVHVVTVNDYLSRRDAAWMGRIYHALGLSVGCLQHESSFVFDPTVAGSLRPVARRDAYAADITYGTNNEFGFDYLRDNMVMRLADKAQRDFHYAIVDEVDSILIDEARTPLIISAPAQESTNMYAQFAGLVKRLVPNEDYNIDEKMRAATLTESGIHRMEQWLGVENIYTSGGITLAHHAEQALKAEALFKIDKDYVVKDGEIIIVDEFTGRLMHGRRYSEGLHQAIEAKEGVKVQKESDTLATVTFQNYFRMYTKLAGMTGTAASEAEEFSKIYKLDVTVVPTHRPMVRKDLADLIYQNEHGKFNAVIADVKARNATGQPVLIGTISIEKNEVLSDLLSRAGVPHNVLNAKQHEKEARILAEAGRKGAVTVATNMAGRGVDVILGGVPPDPSQPIEGETRTREEWQKEHEEVVALGGLHVVGTERHESRRIDNQLRGRSGRQGDPGSSQFFISLDDDLMRIFASERMKSVMKRLGVPEDMPIEHRMITRGLEAAQHKVEGHNFDIRKHLLEYDDVLNKHRDVIYKKRREILEMSEPEARSQKPEALREMILEMVADEIESVVAFHTHAEDERQWNIQEIYEVVSTIFPIALEARKQLTDFKAAAGNRAQDAAAKTKIIEYLVDLATTAYEELEQKMNGTLSSQERVGVRLEGEVFSEIQKGMLLRAIDTLWVEHLDAIDQLREGIGLRGYGQRDPLVE
ncbi:preprotein translocase subunit SecA, partial [Candidatus Uhrbacteria bacterium]|nr:preprotein translocase subunit SecA [Candidatus Uhrbacteria bacterium]